MPDSSAERLRRIWTSYNIPPRLINARLNNYYPQNDQQLSALQRCCAYANDGLENIMNGCGLFFEGPVGTGKTHLAVATVYEIVARNVMHFGNQGLKRETSVYGHQYYEGIQCFFASVVELLDAIRSSYHEGREGYRKFHGMIMRARNDELVILDDLGAEKPTDWVEEQLYGLIDYRYRNKLCTFFTTNCSIKTLKNNLGAHTVSRIMEMSQGILVTGPDYRTRYVRSD